MNRGRLPLLEWRAQAELRMEPHEITRKLAAILSAGVAGYSRLMQADEAATVETLNAYRVAAHRVIERHGPGS